MGKKILIVITNHSTYPTKKEKTGLWLAELVHFHDLLAGAGYEMDFASPKGGAVPIDPRSLSKVFLDRSSKARYHDPGFMRRLEHTLSPDQVIWEDYIAVYYTGGHGTMWDFPENERFQEISRNIYEHGGVVSAVCHGNGALVNIRRSDGTYLITGKKVTGFSNLEEKMALMKKEVPFLLEDAMKERDAKYEKAMLPFTSCAVADGRLVTGQNPQSTKAVAQHVLELLKKMG